VHNVQARFKTLDCCPTLAALFRVIAVAAHAWLEPAASKSVMCSFHQAQHVIVPEFVAITNGDVTIHMLII
jgi:hypothetical protein